MNFLITRKETVGEILNAVANSEEPRTEAEARAIFALTEAVNLKVSIGLWRGRKLALIVEAGE